MRILLSILALSFVGMSAQAEDVPARWDDVRQKFSFSSFNSYYHCDYVERQATRTLEALGAQNIKVDCRGGLPDWDINWITAEFSVLRTADADKATTTARVVNRGLEFRESCDLNKEMTRRFLREFEVTDSNRRGSCRDSRGRLKYNVQLLGQ